MYICMYSTIKKMSHTIKKSKFAWTIFSVISHKTMSKFATETMSKICGASE